MTFVQDSCGAVALELSAQFALQKTANLNGRLFLANSVRWH